MKSREPRSSLNQNVAQLGHEPGSASSSLAHSSNPQTIFKDAHRKSGRPGYTFADGRPESGEKNNKSWLHYGAREIAKSTRCFSRGLGFDS